MKTAIELNQYEGGDNLKNLFLEKTSGFRNFFEQVESCKVIFKLTKKGKDQTKVAEITFIAPESTFLAEDQIVTFELALDAVVNELQQLKKYKEKTIADVTAIQNDSATLPN